MSLCKWEQLPAEMQTEAVREYYDILKKKRVSRFLKRAFDIVASLLLLILLSPIFLILAIAIKLDSKGPVFYRQVRVTRYGKTFRIHKFRTMVQDADKKALLTVGKDSRVTRVGRLIRQCRLDEICQVIDVLCGNMTFVGTRPEVQKYVDQYTPEMLATLLLPAGITNEACIYYKHEYKILGASDDPERAYVEEVLPGKMYYNLKSIRSFGFWHDIKVMFMTVLAVLGKDYQGDYVAPVRETSNEQNELNEVNESTKEPMNT